MRPPMTVLTRDAIFAELDAGRVRIEPFSRDQMNNMLSFADTGIDRLIAIQRETLGDALAGLVQTPEMR